MGIRFTTTHGLRATGDVRRLLTAVIVALVLVMVLGAASASVASPTSCRVRNTDSRRDYQVLQAAVDAARSGQTLIVQGTCHGTTVIDKNLLVEGRRTKRSGRPTLDGDDKVTPLVVRRTRPGRWRGSTRIPHVTVRGLTIENGRARPASIIGGADRGEAGGGVWNDGYLRLVDVVVRDSQAAEYGGGIYTEFAHLWLSGTTRVVGNTSGGFGGGVFCWYGRVTLNGSSSIVGNRARDGGGVACWGPLYMNGSSALAGNGAGRDGGGALLVNTSVELNDTATVRDNRADRSGAGIYHHTFIDDENSYPSGITLTGSSSITGNRAGGPETCCGQGCRKRWAVGGGLWVGPASVLTMTEASVISGNDATCYGGGLYSQIDPDEGGALTGVNCAPQTLANVYDNTPDDCSFG